MYTFLCRDNLKSYHYRDHFYSRRVVGGQHSRTGGLSVSLAGPDGRVLGGGVAGLLTAASPVQVCHCFYCIIFLLSLAYFTLYELLSLV